MGFDARFVGCRNLSRATHVEVWVALSPMDSSRVQRATRLNWNSHFLSPITKFYFNLDFQHAYMGPSAEYAWFWASWVSRVKLSGIAAGPNHADNDYMHRRSFVSAAVVAMGVLVKGESLPSSIVPSLHLCSLFWHLVLGRCNLR